MKLMELSAFLLATASSTFATGAASGQAGEFEGAAYDRATAHEPDFADRSAWPKYLEVEKTAYFKQGWPKRPVMIWNARDRRAKVDGNDPANWTIDGEPATSLPDRDVDVIFPEGTHVRLKQKRMKIHVRHLTVGKGVRVAKAMGIVPHGNVWIKRKGRVEQVGSFSGPGDVFLRNDNHAFLSREAAYANKILFNKARDASVEIIGTMKAWDEMGFMSGKIIVGPNSSIVPGNRSVQCVFPDAQLILMSGAKFHKRGNQPYGHDLVVAGRLRAGTDDRPLERDCTVALSFKAKGVPGLTENGNAGKNGDYGMVVRNEGTLEVTSADPARARLVITWNGLNSKQHSGAGAPDTKERKVDVVFEGKVDLDGIMFDCIRTGGICVADPSVRNRGRIFYGEKNEGPADALFARLPESLRTKMRYDAARVPKPYSQQTAGERREGDGVMH